VKALAFALILAVVSIPTIAAADEVPVDPPVPETLEPEPEPVAPPGSRCPDLYPVVVEHWPNAALHWPLLDKILWRESRCRPNVINRYGCVGLMQICRINHRRLGVTRADLLDAGTNIEIGYRLCLEQTRARRSCWRPWWVGRWRP
jgi:soluble lytic murein transglycosylase-like protein